MLNSPNVNFDTWLDDNLKKGNKNSPDGVSWNTIFASTIWHIWKMRNEFQLTGNDQSDNQVAIKSINFAEWIKDAFKKDDLNITTQNNLSFVGTFLSQVQLKSTLPAAVSARTQHVVAMEAWPEASKGNGSKDFVVSLEQPLLSKQLGRD